MGRRARLLFLCGALGLVLFEVANVYFVMPMPGSQRMNSVGFAYGLYRARWLFRALFGLLAVVGLSSLWRGGGRARRWAPAVLAGALLAAVGVPHQMAADRMFRQPESLRMVPAAESRIGLDRLVLGVEIGGEARAYPIQLIGYHHQVRDRVGGTEVLVSYCTVCRTGRVFSPLVDGQVERFRLVGMDRFNAMFEDASTGSWWRQATGEAVTGPRKGQRLPVLPSAQLSLGLWLKAHPGSLVMQPDPRFAEEYPKDDAYERGTSRKTLTGTNPASWGEKSWVVGVEVDGRSKAFDWNRLKRERLLHERVGEVPVLVVLDDDGASFAAYRRPSAEARYTRKDGALVEEGARQGAQVAGGALVPVAASQEFWHSWRTFHPGTERDG